MSWTHSRSCSLSVLAFPRSVDESLVPAETVFFLSIVCLVVRNLLALCYISFLFIASSSDRVDYEDINFRTIYFSLVNETVFNVDGL